MERVKILVRCLVKEYRRTQYLSWRYAEAGEYVEVGEGVNGFRRVIEAVGGSLEECGYVWDEYSRRAEACYSRQPLTPAG